MATAWERATHSVNRMFSLLIYICIFVISVISHLGFADRIMALIEAVPCHYLLFKEDILSYFWQNSLATSTKCLLLSRPLYGVSEEVYEIIISYIFY